jgi:hypothetical protein
MKMRMAITLIAAAIGTSDKPAFSAVERPPQFVLMAFDNCTELNRWLNLSTFVNDMKANGVSVQFTFFVSGVNFLAEEKRTLYAGPHHKPGHSPIDFGGTPDEVSERVALINRLRAAGSEIGSHAVGHFPGGDEHWTSGDWTAEFQSYKELFLNIGKNNGLPPDVKFDFPFDQIVGFRAPYLNTTPELYPVLTNNKFRYDTSNDHDANAWPKREQDIWRFYLANLKIAGTGRPTLSMDYNFYEAQSHNIEDPDN